MTQTGGFCERSHTSPDAQAGSHDGTQAPATHVSVAPQVLSAQESVHVEVVKSALGLHSWPAAHGLGTHGLSVHEPAWHALSQPCQGTL